MLTWYPTRHPPRHVQPIPLRWVPWWSSWNTSGTWTAEDPTASGVNSWQGENTAGHKQKIPKNKKQGELYRTHTTLFSGCLTWFVFEKNVVELYHMIKYITILYYTILYYTILYYTILYCTVLYCTVLYCTVLYYTILYYTILYYTILYYTILRYTILYCTVLYYTILYCTILYYAVLYCTVLYYTVLYRTILLCTVLYYTILYDTYNCYIPGWFSPPLKPEYFVSLIKFNTTNSLSIYSRYAKSWHVFLLPSFQSDLPDQLRIVWGDKQQLAEIPCVKTGPLKLGTCILTRKAMNFRPKQI